MFSPRRQLVALGLLALAGAPRNAAAQVGGATTATTPALVPPALVTRVEPERPGSETTGATVVLTLTIDASGKVTDAVVATSGGDAFDAASVAAARQFVFSPATRDGKPIAAKIPYTFTFEAAPSPVAEEAPPPASGAMRGAVRTPGDEPLPGAVVTIKRGKEPVATRTTDATGAFVVEGLDAGTYHVEVSAEGFSPYAVDEEISARTVTEVTYRPSPKSDGVEIVVTGKRPPREVTKHEISAAEVRTIPGTNGDALRAIENMPGVARPPGLSGMLIVRGSGPKDTAVFIDGTEVPIAYHFGGLTSVVPSDVLERIDFYPGNFGPEFGRAKGGVVDVGLRSPKKRFSGVLQLDLLDGRVLVEGPITDKTRFLVAMRRSWIDAWIGPALKASGAGVTAAPVYYDGQLVLEHDVSSSTTLRLAAFGSSDRLALILNSPPEGDPITSASQSTQFFRFQLRADTRLGEGTRWRNMISWGEDLMRLDIGDRYVDVTTRPVNFRSDIRAKLSPAFSIVGGTDIQWTTGSISLLVPPPDRPGAAPAPMFAQPATAFSFDANVLRPGAYVMTEIAPVKTLKLLPGVRSDYSSDTKKVTVSPRFVARWDVQPDFPRTTVKAGVGLFHQPPQMEESVAPYGTPGLRSERATHYSAGVEQELTRALDVSLEGFYKDLGGLVVQSDAAGQTASGASYSNMGTGKVYGGELLARWKDSGRFYGWLSYTLSRSERQDGPNQPTRAFEFDQTHILTALGSYKLGRGWELGARWRYVTGSPYTPWAGGIGDLDAGGYAAIPGRPWSARSEAFHRLDLRVEKAWNIGAGKLSAYLDLQNVYNRQNPEGRSYNYNYSRSQPLAGLPLLPIIGLRGEL